MEVLMSRQTRTRVSRPLIAALGVTLAVGGGAYLHNVLKKNRGQVDHDRMSLKAVDPDVLDVKAPAVAFGINAPPPTMLTQTPGGVVASPIRLAMGPANAYLVETRSTPV